MRGASSSFTVALLHLLYDYSKKKNDMLKEQMKSYYEMEKSAVDSLGYDETRLTI